MFQVETEFQFITIKPVLFFNEVANTRPYSKMPTWEKYQEGKKTTFSDDLFFIVYVTKRKERRNKYEEID